jgi:hypothetical protein
MSGGRPGLRTDPHDPDSSHLVVYAEGWDARSDRSALAATDVGGDDFVEHLHLTPPDSAAGRPLIDVMRAGAADGYRWLVGEVTADTLAVRLSRTGPDGR